MRAWTERQQSWIYLLSILLGLAVGLNYPNMTRGWGAFLWPLLGGLLYATFTQVPLTRIGEGFRDRHFLVALLLGNFVLIPLVLGGLVAVLPLSAAVQAGVLMVLLVPCTDWFISFTHLGKGDASRAIAATPVLLLVQLLALPVYLWLFLDGEWLRAAISTHLLSAFAAMILTPLALAWGTEHLAQRNHNIRPWVSGLSILPVPLLALVVFVIAASQVTTITGLTGVLMQVLPIFVTYLVFVAYLGKTLGKLFRLPAPSTRTLTFSFGTRNSFVVLPLALALPDTLRAAVIVIVFQSLVELFGMVVYISWIPRKLIPSPCE